MDRRDRQRSSPSSRTPTRPLPQDTSKQIRLHLAECNNLGLVLDKFQPWQPIRGGWDLGFEVSGKHEPRIAVGNEAKGHWISTWEDRKRQDPTLDPNQRIDSELLLESARRWQGVVAASKAQSFPMWAKTRVVIGLGGKGTLEMGLTLHPTYGFPVIPASAIKGLARTTALFELAIAWGVPAVSYDEFVTRKVPPEGQQPKKTPLNKLEGLLEAPEGKASDPQRYADLAAKLKALQDDDEVTGTIRSMSMEQVALDSLFQRFRAVFGCLSRSGGVIFFDAIPAEVPTLVTEVMNPHFPDYYGGHGMPHDADSPKPVMFLAVERGAQFTFALAPRRGAPTRCVDDAKRWLTAGLKEFGIGGKTSSGFGILETRP